MDAFKQIEGDLAAAMGRAISAADSDERRRAMRDVLANLYAAYEHVGAKPHQRRVPAGASEYQHGCCEALMVCRVLDQHVPGAGFEYRTQPLYPSDDLVPSDYLVPDANLCIRRAGPELEAALERVDRKAGQDELRARAGSPVLPLVDAAMAYLKWLHETEKTPHPPSRS